MTFDPAHIFAEKRFMAIARHKPTVVAINFFTTALGADLEGFCGIEMDRVEAPDAFDGQVERMLEQLQTNDYAAVVMAAKVNDAEGDACNLLPLLTKMKNAGLGNTPVVITYIKAFPKDVLTAIKDLGINVHVCEFDDASYRKPTDKPGQVRTGGQKIGAALIKLCGN